MQQYTDAVGRFELEPEEDECMVLIRRECEVRPAPGMQQPHGAEEDRSIQFEMKAMKVHAERLEPITEDGEVNEQRTEAWITGRWQPVTLHPTRDWVERISTSSAAAG